MNNNLVKLTAILGLTVLFSFALRNIVMPATLQSQGLLLEYSIDDMITSANLIVIGEAVTILPVKWNDPNGSDPTNASLEEISQARGLFTDSVISINKFIKGDSTESNVRVRSYIGKTDKVNWVNEDEPSFVNKKTYLLFLVRDVGATAKVDPGDYISLGAYQGVYEIVDGKAISKHDEWVLEELIAYIQKTLSEKE